MNGGSIDHLDRCKNLQHRKGMQYAFFARTVAICQMAPVHPTLKKRAHAGWNPADKCSVSQLSARKENPYFLLPSQCRDINIIQMSPAFFQSSHRHQMHRSFIQQVYNTRIGIGILASFNDTVTHVARSVSTSNPKNETNPSHQTQSSQGRMFTTTKDICVYQGPHSSGVLRPLATCALTLTQLVESKGDVGTNLSQ